MAIRYIRPTARRRNIAQGFYDQTGFHPIRSSPDYDSSRGDYRDTDDDGEPVSRRRRRPAAKKRATKRAKPKSKAKPRTKAKPRARSKAAPSGPVFPIKVMKVKVTAKGAGIKVADKGYSIYDGKGRKVAIRKKKGGPAHEVIPTKTEAVALARKLQKKMSKAS